MQNWVMLNWKKIKVPRRSYVVMANLLNMYLNSLPASLSSAVCVNYQYQAKLVKQLYNSIFLATNQQNWVMLN